MKSNEDLLREILERITKISYVKAENIPDIDLYMDQVTTFMEDHLKNTKRVPEDKILTKTMINNYAKNNLLPPPIKKKYSKEHMLLLLFIYYFKNLLSFNDIERLFEPLTINHFSESSNTSLVSVYEEVCSLGHEQMERLQKDVILKFRDSEEKFQESDPSEREYLQRFAFICELAFDVYLKKQMIELLIDEMFQQSGITEKKKK